MRTMPKNKVTVLPKQGFDEYCLERGITDMNVEKLYNLAFISICCSKDAQEYCYQHYGEEDNHYFNENHKNVINLDFDDVDEDGIYDGVELFSINEKQVLELYNFIENNSYKDFIIHCRAGKSRSRAVGIYIVENYDYEPNLSYGNDLSDRGNVSVLSSLNRVYREKEDLKCKWRELHKSIVNQILTFCNENDVTNVTDVDLHIDGVNYSTPYKVWQAATDSSFSAYNSNDKTTILASV